MSEFHALQPLSLAIPDDLTIPQFILDSRSYLPRPSRPPTTPCLIDDKSGRAVHHSDLISRTHGLANAFSLRWNIKRNDVVSIFSPNHIDYPVAIWATHRLGAVITPANPAYTADELVYQLQATKAVLLITHPTSLHVALQAAEMANLGSARVVLMDSSNHSEHGDNYHTLDDLVQYGLANETRFKECVLQSGEAKRQLAFLSFSSGTTGKPKAVAIPHYSVIANVVQMACHYRLNDASCKDKRMSPGDIAVAVLPFYHIYGLVVNLHYILYSGMSIVVIPKFNFTKFLESIVRHRITHLFVVPPQVVLLCKHPITKNYDLSHVKFCMSGAAPLSGELLHRLTEIAPNAVIGQGYGLTETCTSVVMVPPTQKVATVGSAGQLIPGITVRVVKADGTLASEGERGELVVKGPSIALGYFNNESATRETFVDGWVRTGDEVLIKNNDLYVVDRLKEIIKVRGFQVAPAELEGHLLLHTDVADACVVGVPDSYSGELPLAFIVLHERALKRLTAGQETIQSLKSTLCKHVADAKVAYKRLEGGVEFIDAIPKNPSGKMLRRVLRDQAIALKRETAGRARL